MSPKENQDKSEKSFSNEAIFVFETIVREYRKALDNWANFLSSAYKALLLFNGGGVLLEVGFLGQIASKEDLAFLKVVIANLQTSIIMFAVGLICVFLSMFFSHQLSNIISIRYLKLMKKFSGLRESALLKEFAKEWPKVENNPEPRTKDAFFYGAYLFFIVLSFVFFISGLIFAVEGFRSIVERSG